MEIVLVFCLLGLIGSLYILAESTIGSTMLLHQVKTKKSPKRKTKARKVKW